MMTTCALLLASLLTLSQSTAVNLIKRGQVGCFICNSYNNSNTHCGDPFSPAYSHYEAQCQQGIADRRGVFPAHFCIKMSGRNKKTGAELVVRTCSVNSMQHQCGIFRFQGETYSGCLTSCDTDACNTSPRVSALHGWLWLVVMVTWLRQVYVRIPAWSRDLVT